MLTQPLRVLLVAALMGIGTLLSGTSARCSPGSDYPLNRGESAHPIETSTGGHAAIDQISLSFNVTHATCFNKKNGSITVLPSNGTGPYTYLWSNNKTTQTISNLAAGTYHVTVSDAMGGTATGFATVTQPAQIIAVVNCVRTCPDQCNGTATVNVLSGGVPPYTYQWSNGATSGSIGNLCPGIYWVTITDANGCKKVVGASLTNWSNLIVSGNVTNIGCNAACTGSIMLSASGGGTAPYTYMWNDGVTTKNRTGLCAGSYSVTVTSHQGCTGTASFVITQQDAPTVVLTPTNPPCFGGTGSIASNVTGTGPFQYIWNTGATTAHLSGLGTGPYAVTVTGANGCTATATTNINIPSAVAITAVAGVCGQGDCAGTANASASGGTPPYSYVWSNGQTGSSASGLCNGTHSVTVTDSKQCTATTTVVINCAPVPCPFPISITGNAVCGQSTATLGIGGIPAGSSLIAANWFIGNTNGSPVHTGATYGAAVPGTYCVIVSVLHNGFECEATACTTIVAPAAPSVNVTGTNANCNGVGGSATAMPSGGTAPYTYLWSNGKTTQTITNLSAGTYHVTVTDANQCTATGFVNITAPPKIIAYINCVNTCPGQCTGIATVYVMQGTAPYTYVWSTGATTQTITGLCAGIYWVTITDAAGCKKIVGAQVVSAPVINLSGVITHPSCFGGCNGTIGLSVSGGNGAPYTYIWNDGVTAKNRSGLCAGSYTVTVTDHKGCTAQATFVLNNPAPTTCTVSGDNVICPGESTQFCASTGASYLWSNGATTQCIPVSMQGTYSVTVTDANGCTSVCSRELTVNPLPACTITGNDSICPGGQTQFCAGTAADYLWSNGATTQCITSSLPGTYSVTITDANGCTAVCSRTLVVNPAPLCTITGPETVCPGGEAELCAAAGMASYAWSNGATTHCITISESGTYSVTITDQNGCTATCQHSVNVTNNLSVSVNTVNESCPEACDGSVTAVVSGGTAPFTYLWDAEYVSSMSIDGSSIYELCPGTYCVTVTDANGCTASACGQVAPAQLVSLDALVTPITCPNACDGAIMLIVSDGAVPYMFEWNDGVTTQNRNGLCAGTYTVTLTDANGCTYTHTETLTNPDSIFASVLLSDVTCYGACDGSASVNGWGGTGSLSILWSNGSTAWAPTGLCAGNYCFTITDDNGCTFTGCLGIGQPDTLTVTAQTTPETCPESCDGSAALTVTGGNLNAPYTYHWNTGATAQSLEDLCAGVYCVTVTDFLGCTATVCFEIGSVPPVTATSESTDANCPNDATGSIVVTPGGGTAPYSIQWNDGSSDFNYVELTAGIYCYTVYDANGCSVSGCDTINEPEPLLAYIVCPCALTLCPGDCSFAADIEVVGGTTPYTFMWSNGATTEDVENLCAGMYSVTITDASGCTYDLYTTPFEWADSIEITHFTWDYESCPGACDGATSLTAIGGYGDLAIEWSNGSTSWSIDGLCDGTYCYTITDELGCSITGCIEIIEPISMTGSVQTDCTPFACGGTATITVQGGNAPYTYAWSNGATNATATGLCNDVMYYVTVTDNNGCVLVDSISVNCPPLPCEFPVVIETANVCVATTATVSLGTLPQGYMAISYQWYNAGGVVGTNATYMAGEGEICVYVEIEYENGTLCVADTCTVVQLWPNPTVVVTATADSCVAENGTATAVASNGTPPYTYVWSNGATGSELSGLTAGSYSVTVTDANGCTATGTAQVTFIECPCPPLRTQTQGGWGNMGGPGQYLHDNFDAVFGSEVVIGCPEGYTLTLTSAEAVTNWLPTGSTPSALEENLVDPNSDGNPDYNNVFAGQVLALTLNVAFDYADPDFADGSDNLGDRIITTGTFAGWTVNELLAEANNALGGCGSIYSLSTLNQAVTAVNENYSDGNTDNGFLACDTIPVCVLQVSATSTHTGCYDECDGTAMLEISGGTEPYSVVWSNGGTHSSLYGLCAGTYGYTVTDANECEVTGQVTVSEPDQLLAVATCPTENLCPGECVASIDVTVYGGTTPYSFVWSNGATTEDLYNLCAGEYYLTITDANGCVYELVRVIGEPDALTATVESTDASVCIGECDGTITLTVSGGTTPYTFEWSNEATSQNLEGLCPGAYTVTITDANGCTYTINDTVIIIYCVPICELFQANVESTNATCPEACDGTATATISGGAEPYSIVWSNGSTSAHLTGLCAGTYSFTATDANGCTVVDQVTIEQPGPILVSLAVNFIAGICGAEPCEGYLSVGILMGGTGPFSYEWNTGSTDHAIGQLCAGEYTVTITDANGCTLEIGPLTITCIPDTVCQPLRTQTQGGYGNMGGPGQYLHANFDEAFGTLVIGCDNTLTFTSAQAITDWLPSTTSPDALPEGNMTDPTMYENVFAAQLVVAELNVGFDYYDADFGAGSQNLGDMYIATGTFAGWTVNELLAEANSAIGGCGSIYSFSELSDALAAINENYVDGEEDHGFLVCGPVVVTPPSCDLVANVLTQNAICYGQLLSSGVATVQGQIAGGTPPYSVQWSNGATTQEASLFQGTHAVTVTDASGCTYTTTFEILCGDAMREGEFDANTPSVIAHPNPFSAMSNISFTLPYDDANVVLEVYSVTGQKVAELFNGAASAGQLYTAKLSGAQLADGMYFYRLVTSTDTFTGQLVRVKQ